MTNISIQILDYYLARWLLEKIEWDQHLPSYISILNDASKPLWLQQLDEKRAEEICTQIIKETQDFFSNDFELVKKSYSPAYRRFATQARYTELILSSMDFEKLLNKKNITLDL